MLELFPAKWKWWSKTSSLCLIIYASRLTQHGPSNVVNQPNTPIYLFPEMVGMSHPELEVYVFSVCDRRHSFQIGDVNVTSAGCETLVTLWYVNVAMEAMAH